RFKNSVLSGRIEGPSPGQHLVSHDTKSEYIARLARPSLVLLRSHVESAARNRRARRHVGHLGILNLGYSKIDDLYLIFSLTQVLEHDVFRLQVAVDNALVVGGCESLTSLPNDIADELEVHAVVPDHRPQVLTSY